ncbi:hypothetical protein K432DRAFT_388595 [Lepidopterella palustris CBS 459.81]|uniref:Uncharacterized protein n=1 Tax=Lepidopterella palustris CBS 459.81 TaxID=1314670 RepID=A0A8E2EK99_9PEZI|nr:hypothetical protein K432DRAFT_388595 [Lepidopterella palustris CBS 459.81]
MSIPPGPSLTGDNLRCILQPSTPHQHRRQTRTLPKRTAHPTRPALQLPRNPAPTPRQHILAVSAESVHRYKWRPTPLTQALPSTALQNPSSQNLSPTSSARAQPGPGHSQNPQFPTPSATSLPKKPQTEPPSAQKSSVTSS